MSRTNVCTPPCSSRGSFAVSLRAVPNGCKGSKQRCQVRKNLLATYRKRAVPAYTEHIALTRLRLLRAWQGLPARPSTHTRLESHGPDGLRQRPGLRPSNKPGLPVCAHPTLHSRRDLCWRQRHGPPPHRLVHPNRFSARGSETSDRRPREPSTPVRACPELASVRYGIPSDVKESIELHICRLF